MAPDPSAATLEAAKYRCLSLRRRIERDLPPSKLSDACRQTLLRLLNAEIRYLSRLSPSELSSPFSLNVGYLESVVQVIEQPSVAGVSRVCKPVGPSPPSPSLPQVDSKPVHIDIVCTLCQKPVWFLVSDRNPKFITWMGSHRSDDGLRARVERVISVARSTVSLKPDSIVLFFSKGLTETISKNLVNDFGASELGNQFFFPEFRTFEELECGWINVVGPGSCAFEINIDAGSIINRSIIKVSEGGCRGGEDALDSSSEFWHLMSSLKEASGDTSNERLINFDTTALIAIVSGISNGDTDRLLKTAEVDLKRQFKGNYEFVMAQVMSELRDPILPEFSDVITGKKGIICESVLSEFKELVSICGGVDEKARACQLLQSLLVVSDSPSARVSALPTTRKLAVKNKTIFGTGDHWRAPTLTANEGFVRAISQSGMSLLTIKHRPRALIGD
ncbi:unnamed protein product [Spirodela intermedia]|uniref:DUF1308 domain-containing protein n=1 Tax=Spirodela intermedia TaxID=51605 RepID=A0A7I8ID76_SPIIN|nr:unnamed protein product [Spirodela intermedia]CAA6655716.1 unnamed protein product [Spirodela intermedia]